MSLQLLQPHDIINKRNDMAKCLCGCGEEVNNRFKHGHNFRVQQPSIDGILKANAKKSYARSALVRCRYCGHTLKRQLCELTNSNGTPKEAFFCNTSHAMRVRTGAKHPKWKGGDEILNCAECKIEFSRHPANTKERTQNVFCSTQCHDEWRQKNYFGDKCSNWQGGKSFEEYCSEWQDSEYKADIRKRDKGMCLNLECPEFSSPHYWMPEKINIHHVNYNKKDCRPKNLISLCHRCNPRANFNRGKWQQYFQALLNDFYGYTYAEGAETIPKGSRPKRAEAQGTRKGDDIVRPAGKPVAAQ